MLSRIALRNVGGLLKNNRVGLVSKRLCTNSTKKKMDQKEFNTMVNVGLLSVGTVGGIINTCCEYKQTRTYALPYAIFITTVNFIIGGGTGISVLVLSPIMVPIGVLYTIARAFDKKLTGRFWKGQNREEYWKEILDEEEKNKKQN